MLKLYLIAYMSIGLLFDGILVWSYETRNNSVSEQPDESEYCFVNESVVRKKLDGTQFWIVDDTGYWLVVSNGTDLLLLSVNISDCEDTYNPDIAIYILKTLVNCFNVLLATCIIVLHLCIKELRTQPGILISILYSLTLVLHVAIFLHNRYQYTHKVNDHKGVCGMFIYVRAIVTFSRNATTIIVFFHFVYLMYENYRLRSNSNFDTKLMCNYVTFIVSLTTIYALVSVPYDIATNRIAFATVGGYCATNFAADHMTTSFVIFTILVSSTIVIQVVLFCIGMALYFMTTKNCCGNKIINVRVCFALVSTSGLNSIMYFISFSFIRSTEIPFLLSSAGTLLEMLVLLIIFLTSTK
ncbi:uncharacterized protein [Dysidea avara]|uniref:uncharacterized protein n=1 Tax=Dysidea avara TaxID=196820 RepID=UPI00332D8B77